MKKSILSDLKPIKTGKNLEQHIALGVKIIQRILDQKSKFAK